MSDSFNTFNIDGHKSLKKFIDKEKPSTFPDFRREVKAAKRWKGSFTFLVRAWNLT